MDIVVDKSFLWSAPAHQLRSVLEMHRAYMPDVLFYEMFKDDEERQNLFRRLPPRLNPINLLPGSGEILRYEIEHRRSAAPLSRHVIAASYRFNPSLASGPLEMEPWMVTANEDRREVYRQAAGGIIALVSLIPEIFPRVANHRPGMETSRPQFAISEGELGRDGALIRMLYGGVRQPTWPRVSHVKRNTAMFRKIQLDCLFALSIFERYGREPPESALNNVIEHDMRDRDYALFATICGAIATRDKRLAKIVLCAEPTTIIIGLGPTGPIRGRESAIAG